MDNNNEDIRKFYIKTAENHNHQKNVFKKLVQSRIELDFKNSYIIKIIKMGIPSQYRSLIWSSLLKNIHGITEKFYHSLLNKGIKMMSSLQSDVCPERQKVIRHLKSIEMDIERTFSELKFFKKQTDQGQALFNILSAWTVYREDIGYLQGMSQIAGLFLTQINENLSFTLFCSLLTTDVMFGFYSMQMCEINKFQHAFQNRVKKTDQELYFCLESLKIQSKQFLLPWILTLFTRLMSFDFIAEIWDLIFLYGVNLGILVEISYLSVVKIKNNSDLHFSDLDQNQFVQTIKSYKFSIEQTYSILEQTRQSYH